MLKAPSFRQGHLAACYGKTNWGTRLVAFAEQGVAANDWTICEWCAVNGCAKDKKLEIVFRGNDTFNCDCDGDHPRADHEDGRPLRTRITQKRAEIDNSKADLMDLERERLEGVLVREPLSKRQKMQEQQWLGYIRSMMIGPAEPGPCPGDENDYELVDCKSCGNHKKWVRKEVQEEESSDSDLNPPLPEPEAGALTVDAITEHNISEFNRLAEAIKEKEGIDVNAPASTPQ